MINCTALHVELMEVTKLESMMYREAKGNLLIHGIFCT